MYVAGPPEHPGSGGLRVAGTARRVFAGSSELAGDPSLRPYLTAMVAPYGLALREEVFEAAAGHSYGEMAEPLIDALVAEGTPVDLLVMAYDLHDVRLGRSTTTSLSSRCPGGPLAFALCDQGVAAPFSALRAVRAHAATGGCRRALLLVVEQSALHYELAEPVAVPARHAAVALLLETADTADTADPMVLRQHRADSPDRARDLLAAELADGGPDTTLVLGAGLAAGWTGHADTDDVVVAPAGQPCTGVWWELSARLPAWRARGRRVVLAEHDPLLGYLCTATMRLGATPATLAHTGGKGASHGHS